MSKYQLTEGMVSIFPIGVPPKYEEQARKLLGAALEKHEELADCPMFLIANKKAKGELEVQTCENGKKIIAHAMAAAGNVSSQVFQAFLTHFNLVKTLGWEKYCERSREIFNESKESLHAARN